MSNQISEFTVSAVANAIYRTKEQQELKLKAAQDKLAAAKLKRSK